MSELVDEIDSKSIAERREGSNPSLGTQALVVELADTRDLKSLARKGMWVQIPPEVREDGPIAQLVRAADSLSAGPWFKSKWDHSDSNGS